MDDWGWCTDPLGIAAQHRPYVSVVDCMIREPEACLSTALARKVQAGCPGATNHQTDARETWVGLEMSLMRKQQAGSLRGRW